MSSFLTTILLLAGGLLGLAVLAYGYYLYAPVPAPPPLSGTLHPLHLPVGGRPRTSHVYVPANLLAHAPLMLVLHGSNQAGRTLRQQTGYEFDALADRYGFAVAYPDGYKQNWNDCRREAPFPAKQENVDDVGFMRAISAHCQATYGIDPQQVYAFGYSNGGQLAFRLAVEAPQLVQAIATSGATLPEPANFACAWEGPTARVLLVCGTKDPITPYAGGEVTLFGFSSRGRNLSARATAEHFARRNGLPNSPALATLPHQHPADPTSVEAATWARAAQPVVALYTVQGGGHVVPQPCYRFPRLLGATAGDLDTPREAIRFFGLDAPR